MLDSRMPCGDRLLGDSAGGAEWPTEKGVDRPRGVVDGREDREDECL